MKKILMLLICLVFLASCNQADKNKESNKAGSSSLSGSGLNTASDSSQINSSQSKFKPAYTPAQFKEFLSKGSIDNLSIPLGISKESCIQKLGKPEKDLQADIVGFEDVFMQYKNFRVVFDYLKNYSDNMLVYKYTFLEGYKVFGLEVGKSTANDIIATCGEPEKINMARWHSFDVTEEHEEYYYSEKNYRMSFYTDNGVLYCAELSYVKLDKIERTPKKPADKNKALEYENIIKQGKLGVNKFGIGTPKTEVINEIGNPNNIVVTNEQRKSVYHQYPDLRVYYEVGSENVTRIVYMGETKLFGLQINKSKSADVKRIFGDPTRIAVEKFDRSADEIIDTSYICYDYVYERYVVIYYFVNDVLSQVLIV